MNTRRTFIASAAAATSVGLFSGSATAAPDDYEVVEASGQTIHIEQGDTYENKLIDLTTGGDILLYVTGGDSVIRNIGFKGLYRGGGFMIGIVADSGEVLVDNVYLGDGATKVGDDFVHGPGAVFYHRKANCDVTFKRMNVQGYTNNGFYCSNTPYGGNVHFKNCFGKNNGVSTFRCGDAGDVIENCVAYNDNTDYGDAYYTDWVESNGRPVWVWNGGEVEIKDSHFAAGPYPYAMVAGANGEPGRASVTGGAIEGEIQEASGSTVTTSNVGDNPDLSPPEGVPMSPEAAAAGGSGDSSPDEPSSPDSDPWTEQYGVKHLYEVENTSDSPVEYYLQIEEGTFTRLDYNGAVIDEASTWTEGDKAAGRVAPGETHAWGFNHLLVDVTIEPAENANARVNGKESSLSWYPQEGADGDAWKDIDELLSNGEDGEGSDENDGGGDNGDGDNSDGDGGQDEPPKDPPADEPPAEEDWWTDVPDDGAWLEDFLNSLRERITR